MEVRREEIMNDLELFGIEEIINQFVMNGDANEIIIEYIKQLQDENERMSNALNELDEIIDGRLYTPLIERLSNAVLRGKGLSD